MCVLLYNKLYKYIQTFTLSVVKYNKVINVCLVYFDTLAKFSSSNNFHKTLLKEYNIQWRRDFSPLPPPPSPTILFNPRRNNFK